MRISILFLLLCGGLCADVHVRNFSANAITADGVPVATLGTLSVTYTGSEMLVQTPTRTQTVYVLDGANVVVDDVDVTVTVPLASYLEIIMKGFYAGVFAELFGLFLRTVRATKSRMGEVV